MPTLMTNTRTGIGIVNYESEANASTIRVVFRGDSTPLDPSTYDWQPSVGTSTSIQTAITVPTTSSAFLLGNYIGLSALPPDKCTVNGTTFVPAWIQGNSKKAQQVAVNTTALSF